MRRMLEKRFAARADGVADLADARRLLAEGEYDVVILDYQLPDGNGLELLKEIASRSEHPRVVMVTGRGAEEVAAEAFRLNASGYVVKDARLADMLPQVVANALTEVSLDVAQEQLKQSEENQRALLNATPETLLLIDLEGTVLTINETGAARFGRTVDDMIGTKLYELFPEELVESRREQVRTLLKTRKPVTFEDRQDDMVLSNVVYPVFDDREMVSRIAIFSRDVTEQKRSADALQRSREELELRVAERTAQLREANEGLREEIEERKKIEKSLTALSVRFEEQAKVLDQILSSSPQQFYLYDSKGKFIYASRAASELLGRAQQEIEGKYWWELGMPEDVMRPIEIKREQVMTTGKPAEGTAELPTRRGMRYFDYTLSPIKRANGKVDTVVGTARDTTEERKAAEKLAKFNARQEELAHLLDLTNETIIVRDMDGRIIFWNAGAEALFGWKRDEAIGRYWRELLKVGHPSPEGDFEEDLVADGRWEGRLGVEGRDGSRITVESRQVVRVDEGGRPNAVLEIDYDVTRWIETDRGLRERGELIDSIPVALIVHDMENRILFWGDGARDLFGWSSDEAVGNSFLELLDAKLTEELPEIEFVLLNDNRWSGVIEYTGRTGRTVSLHAHWFLRYSEGRPDSVVQLLS